LYCGIEYFIPDPAQQEEQIDGKLHYLNTLAGRLLTVGSSSEASMDNQPGSQKGQGAELAESIQAVVGEEGPMECSH